MIEIKSTHCFQNFLTTLKVEDYKEIYKSFQTLLKQVVYYQLKSCVQGILSILVNLCSQMQLLVMEKLLYVIFLLQYQPRKGTIRSQSLISKRIYLTEMRFSLTLHQARVFNLQLALMERRKVKTIKLCLCVKMNLDHT